MMTAVLRFSTCLVSAAILSCGATRAAAQPSLPAGDGAALVLAKCTPCHGFEVVTASAGISGEMWEQVLEDMQGLGLSTSEDEKARLLEYLVDFLGPDPPKTPSTQPQSATRKLTPMATELYRNHCEPCHLENGRGVEDRFPPLAGNPYLRGNPLYTVRVILFGLEGEIEVADQKFHGLMPGFPQLVDAEIATVADYVRGAWGNASKGSTTAAIVARERRTRLEPKQVQRLRQK